VLLAACDVAHQEASTSSVVDASVADVGGVSGGGPNDAAPYVDASDATADASGGDAAGSSGQGGGAAGSGGHPGSAGEAGSAGSAGCVPDSPDVIETNHSTGIAVDTSLMETIYNPFVIFDTEQSVYKMWYAGWQSKTADFPHDKIYYRTSAGGVSGWSDYQTVWTPKPPYMPVDGYHVNSPAVLKHWDAVVGAWQYTMFFELAESGAVPQHESMWSVISSDGLTWHTPLMLRPAGDEACDMTMVESLDGAHAYQVLFTGSGGAKLCGDRFHIWRVKADAQRSPSFGDAEVAYTAPPEVSAVQGILANPHAARVNGRWHLWFNVYHGPAGNHYTDIAKATCCASGPGGELGTCTGFAWVLKAPMTGQPGEPCTTATPGVLEMPGDPTRYRLYQALGYRDADAVCRWYPRSIIHMQVRD
jgi:hypothetical protein